jgi:zinc/manganese transport system permease protein
MWDILQFLLPAFVAFLTLVGIHSYLGIHVLQREIIFIDIALAQVAAVGTTLAHTAWHAEEHSFVAYLSSLGLTLIAAFFFTKVKKRVTQIPQEAVIGVSYAIAAAGALFIMALSTGSDVHMEHMLTGSILWAGWSDILTCAAVYGGVGIFHYIFRHRFIKVSEDYSQAVKEGINVELWDFLFYATVGLVVTHAVRIAGVLVVFALLVIPATISAMYAESWKNRIIIAYVLGLIVSILGLSFSYVADFSAGPSVVAFLGIALLLAAIFNKKRPKETTES